MTRLATFDAFYIFPLIEKTKVKTVKGIERVCVGTKKLLLFKKSPICVGCGCEGTIFHLEENEYGKRILNLFAIKGDKEVMMTIDHIIPRSKGGTRDQFNLQVMCFDCNLRKGNKIELDWLDKDTAKILFRDNKYRKLLGKDNVKKLGEIVWGEYNGNDINISN